MCSVERGHVCLESDEHEATCKQAIYTAKIADSRETDSLRDEQKRPKVISCLIDVH